MTQPSRWSEHYSECRRIMIRGGRGGTGPAGGIQACDSDDAPPGAVTGTAPVTSRLENLRV